MQKQKTQNLTQGNVWKILLFYMLPLFGSAMVQQVYSMVDLLVVGNFAANGEQALYAVGQATIIVNVLMAFCFGANGGCSVVIAKHYGAGDNKKVWETVYTSLIVFSALCATVMAVGFALGKTTFQLMQVQPEAMADSITYLFIYTGSLPFVFLYNICNGICSALGDSKSPFIFLVISSVLNILLDLLFVCVFHWDVAGVAWATFIAQAISSVLTVFVVIKKLRTLPCEQKPKKFDKAICKDIIVTSVPVILQNCFISIGNLFVQGRINQIVVDGNPLAASVGFTAGFKLMCFSNIGIVTMTNGFSLFCSQNLAAGQIERVKKGYWITILYAVAITLLFTLALSIFREPLAYLFIDNPTPQSVECAKQFLLTTSLFLPVVSIKITTDNAIRGCGGNIGFAIATLVDLGSRVALVYLLTYFGLGFTGVCWSWPLGWFISIGVSFIFYFTNKVWRKPRATVDTAMEAINCNEV